MPSKSELKHFVRKWATVQIPDYHRPSSFCNQNLFWLLSMLRLKTGAAWSFQSLGSKLHVITAAERGREKREGEEGRDRKINLRTDTEVKDRARRQTDPAWPSPCNRVDVRKQKKSLQRRKLAWQAAETRSHHQRRGVAGHNCPECNSHR